MLLVKNIDLATLSDAVCRICEPRLRTRPIFIAIIIINVIFHMMLNLNYTLENAINDTLLRHQIFIKL